MSGAVKKFDQNFNSQRSQHLLLLRMLRLAALGLFECGPDYDTIERQQVEQVLMFSNSDVHIVSANQYTEWPLVNQQMQRIEESVGRSVDSSFRRASQ